MFIWFEIARLIIPFYADRLLGACQLGICRVESEYSAEY